MSKTAKPKEEKVKSISDLIPDQKNINKGTEEGSELIEKSIQELGFGRSIVVDKNNNIISGNKTTAAAIRAGKQKVKIIETNGDELVVVRRNDVDINTTKGAKLKILDNTTSRKNYVQDAEVAEAICEEYNLNAGQYGLDEFQGGPAGTIKKIPIVAFKKSHVLISFPPERMVQLQALFEKVQKMEGVEIEQSSN